MTLRSTHQATNVKPTTLHNCYDYLDTSSWRYACFGLVLMGLGFRLYPSYVATNT